MIQKIKYLISNFHRPFIESFKSWYLLMTLNKKDNSIDVEFYKEFYWDELSMYSPSYPYMDKLDFWKHY
jgi:hypothetical protein